MQDCARRHHHLLALPPTRDGGSACRVGLLESHTSPGHPVGPAAPTAPRSIQPVAGTGTGASARSSLDMRPGARGRCASAAGPTTATPGSSDLKMPDRGETCASARRSLERGRGVRCGSAGRLAAYLGRPSWRPRLPPGRWRLPRETQGCYDLGKASVRTRRRGAKRGMGIWRRICWPRSLRLLR